MSAATSIESYRPLRRRWRVRDLALKVKGLGVGFNSCGCRAVVLGRRSRLIWCCLVVGEADLGLPLSRGWSGFWSNSATELSDLRLVIIGFVRSFGRFRVDICNNHRWGEYRAFSLFFFLGGMIRVLCAYHHLIFSCQRLFQKEGCVFRLKCFRIFWIRIHQSWHIFTRYPEQDFDLF